jgi:hypothetical protein
MNSLFFSSFGLVGLIGTAFWVWMLYECLRSGRRNHQWLYILIFLNVIGAFLYFILEWLPKHPEIAAKISFSDRQKRRDRLWQAEADAKNIGNATQFITLGNILFDLRETQRAYEAYQQALAKEPKNSQALWGAAQSASEKKDYTAAKDYLSQLIKVNPEFSYGQASLAYGEVLYQLQAYDEALAHLRSHLKLWSNPEGFLMLADIQSKQKDSAAARETLETMIIKIKGFVPFQYRKNEHFIRQAERKLKSLPKTAL